MFGWIKLKVSRRVSILHYRVVRDLPGGATLSNKMIKFAPIDSFVCTGLDECKKVVLLSLVAFYRYTRKCRVTPFNLGHTLYSE